jgi:hypothetical protein
MLMEFDSDQRLFELDETDTERLEGFGRLTARGRQLRDETLRCPCHKGSATRKQQFGHVRSAAPRAPILLRPRRRTARIAPTAR